MLGIPPDRFDHQLRRIGAMLTFPATLWKQWWLYYLGFCVVVEPIGALSVVVFLRGKQHGKRHSFRWVSDS